MSDTSGDSSVGARCDVVDTLFHNQNDNHLGDQECNQDDDGSKSECSKEDEDEDEAEAEGEGEDDDGHLIEETPLSKNLGYADIFAMKDKMDSVDDHVCVHKSTLRHQKRVVNKMRHQLVDTAPMAAKVCRHMRITATRYLAEEINKASKAASRAKGPANVAVKELLAQTDFRAKLLDGVEQEIMGSDDFPQTNLKTEIGGIVKSHLRTAVLKRAQEKKEVELLQKFAVDKQKAMEAVEQELKDAGLME